MLINIQDVEARFTRLRLQAGDIAQLAGLHRTTWHRALRGDVELRGRNVRKLVEALKAEEQLLLEHLIALHPERARELLSSQRGSRDGTGGAEGSDMARRAAGDGMDGEGAAASGEAAPAPNPQTDFSASPQGGGKEDEEAAA